MEILVLASGSSGNAVLVRGPSGAVLVDAGISNQALRRRLAVFGIGIEDVTAIVITHEHQDHVRGLDVLLRKTVIPVWMSRGTADVLGRTDANVLGNGALPKLGGLEVSAVRTSHDAADPIAVVLSDGQRRVGVCTDTGVVSPLLRARLQELDLLLLEANHDADLLRHGRYPWVLKQRIASRHGHLANHQAAETLRALRSPRLAGVVALHLSEENNRPELVEQGLSAAVDRALPVAAVSRHEMLQVALDGAAMRLQRHGVPAGRRRSSTRG